MRSVVRAPSPVIGARARGWIVYASTRGSDPLSGGDSRGQTPRRGGVSWAVRAGRYGTSGVERGQAGAGGAQLGLGVLAQLGQQVAAGERRLQRLLHQPREVGVARVLQPALRLRDRHLQRARGALV